MKNKTLSSILILVSAAAVASAAPNVASDKQLEVYPKNLARQNSGANLFVYNATNQSYVPTEAAAAWLDDDVATGWPAELGKHYYMVALPESQLVTNFSLLAKSGAGSINVYTSDDPAPPDSKSWTLVAHDVAFDSVNGKKLSAPFSRVAKYVLIETNLSDCGPVYSLYLYGGKPAVGYSLEKRAQSVDTHSVFGSYVNSQVAFNQSSLYAKARVTYANGGTGSVDWQKLLADNPDDSLLIAPSTNEAGVALSYNGSPSIQRISVLTDPTAKGKLDFFLVTATESGGAPSLANLTPTTSIVLNGNNASSSVDFQATPASTMLVRWTPADGKQPLALRQIDSFDDISLADYQLAGSLDAIAQGGDVSKDGKDVVDAKDNKNVEPVAELLPPRVPFVPGGLGDPALLLNNRPGFSNPPPTNSTPPRPFVVPVSP